MSFDIFEPTSNGWTRAFGQLPPERQDVFYAPGYARVCQQEVYPQDDVLCAAMQSGDDIALYPFVKRNLARLTGLEQYAPYSDMTGLYGRGGIVFSKQNENFASEFHEALKSFCQEQEIVCGFDRFHPLWRNDADAPHQMKIMDVGGFVVVDLQPALADIEKSFKQSVRKDIRKSVRNGVTCFAEEGATHLGRFLEIYQHTMTRNQAGDFYYFPESFFHAIVREMPGQFVFFYAQVGDEIISCELVLYHGKYAHSFLGGTLREALPLGANPALKWEIIRHIKQMGGEYFLLGGGTYADDRIFKFKKAYAPEGVYPSRIGGAIWNQDVYDALKQDMTAAGRDCPTGRFQFYDAT